MSRQISASPRCTCGHLKAQHRTAPVGCVSMDRVGRFCSCGQFVDKEAYDKRMAKKKQMLLKRRPPLSVDMEPFVVEAQEKRLKPKQPKPKKPDPMVDERAPRTWDEEV